MPNCSVMTSRGTCGVLIDEEGSDKCYVHRMLFSNNPISEHNKFIPFLQVHQLQYPLFDEKYGFVQIDFPWNMSEILNQAYSESETRISSPIKLQNMVFNANVRFRGFSSSFDLINCVFSDSVEFRGVRFPEKSILGQCEHHFINVSFKKEADFRYSKFNNCSFKEVDLSKCFFTGAEFNYCNFTNCRWAKKGKIIVRRGVIYDELDFLRDNKCQTSYSDLEKIYRRLKAIAKAWEDRWMEGEFHYSENEIIMRRTKWYLRDGLSSRAYYYANRFGERPSAALLNAVIIICAWMFFYAYSGVEIYTNGNFTINYNFSLGFHFKPSDLLYLFAYALYPVSLNKLVGPSNIVTYLLSVLESALLVTQIGLFVNALRRKLQR